MSGVERIVWVLKMRSGQKDANRAKCLLHKSDVALLTADTGEQ